MDTSQSRTLTDGRDRLTRAVGASILYAMWGYAEGDRTAVTIVVVILAIAAVAYVARRLWRRGR